MTTDKNGLKRAVWEAMVEGYHLAGSTNAGDINQFCPTIIPHGRGLATLRSLAPRQQPSYPPKPWQVQ